MPSLIRYCALQACSHSQYQMSVLTLNFPKDLTEILEHSHNFGNVCEERVLSDLGSKNFSTLFENLFSGSVIESLLDSKIEIVTIMVKKTDKINNQRLILIVAISAGIHNIFLEKMCGINKKKYS